MKPETIASLVENFESHVHKTDEGVDFWLARDLQILLGYSAWQNFTNVITKAKTACEISGKGSQDHFIDINKMVDIGSGAKKEVDDMMLTRYACYLTAQNGDSSKEAVAFAQTYFAIQTRNAEIIQQRIAEVERIRARDKLSKTEKELSSIIFEQTGSDKNFGLIRSKGDKALFGYTTSEMKDRLKIPQGRAIADFQPTILLKAKDFATEITIFNTKTKKLRSELSISDEHITNNRSVRKILISRGIQPEQLPAEEDIKKVERKLRSDEDKTLKKLGKLD